MTKETLTELEQRVRRNPEALVDEVREGRVTPEEAVFLCAKISCGITRESAFKAAAFNVFWKKVLSENGKGFNQDQLTKQQLDFVLRMGLVAQRIQKFRSLAGLWDLVKDSALLKLAETLGADLTGRAEVAYAEELIVTEAVEEITGDVGFGVNGFEEGEGPGSAHLRAARRQGVGGQEQPVLK